MSARKGMCALADVWWYQLFRTVHDPLRSGLPIAGSKQAPISSEALSNLPTGVHLQVPLYGFCERARHVPVVSGVAVEGGAFINKPSWCL